MTSDTGSEEAINAKEAFSAFIAKLPEQIRDEVEAAALENEWSVETYRKGLTNAERWAETLYCAQMIADAPADYGINA
jgi:hypothetical protein